ncbi:MAG: LemA family protein [Opitutaceae bacterium]|nr:LemA family protein [Verrucomicrobiales bacterium]
MNGPEWIIVAAPWILMLMSISTLVGSVRAARKKRLVDDIPTSKTTGVFIGLVELKGTAEVERVLLSHLAGQPCVQYAWRVDEHWSRLVTETYTDSKGNTQTRIRHESGWTTVASGGEVIPFYLRDNEGAVLIKPEGANIEGASIFNITCGRGDALYYGKGPAHAVSDSDHRRCFVESAIVLHAPIYVVGQSRERADVVAPEIAADKDAPLFLISTRTEEQVSRSYGWGGIGWGILGLVLWGGAGFFFSGHFNQGQTNPWIIVGAVVIFLGLWLLSWVWMVYNSIIDLRQRVRQGWSQVDVQLKRRFDLVPNLVSAITGYRDYEQQLQTELAALRSQAIATPPGVAGPDYAACLPTILAIEEKYPELKAQENFLHLQKTLADTEQRIALARGYFNEIASFYNARLEVVPDRFIAALGRLEPQPLMAANDFERAPVTVEFAT